MTKIKYSLKSLLLIVLIVISSYSKSQELFDVSLEEQTSFTNIPPVHSGAFFTYNNYWVFIGGRTNGLHGFLTPLAFPSSGKNTLIYVYNPQNDSVYTSDLTGMPDSLFEPLTSSNMEFVQKGNIAYLAGGYGFSNSFNDFFTFNTLTQIDLSQLVNAVVHQQPVVNLFRQRNHPIFKVTGGHLKLQNDTFYLVFGHSFDGIYNRLSTSNFYVQNYTKQIRKFCISPNASNFNVSSIQILEDTIQFRRRDYNLVSQIYPNHQRGFTAFSGVFQPGVDLPYTNTIDILPNYQFASTFNQQLSNYHSAVMPVYDSTFNAMHTVFFGGMASYYYNNSNQLVYDSLVPFVKTISMVSRNSVAELSETHFNQQMPSLLGSNAVFVPLNSVPMASEEIINLSNLSGVSHVGYLISGIESPDINIADSDPSLSTASTRVFKVFIDKTINKVNSKIEGFRIKNFPNPCNENLNVELSGVVNENLNYRIISINGIEILPYSKVPNSQSFTTLKIPTNELKNGTYYLQIKGKGVNRVSPFTVMH